MDTVERMMGSELSGSGAPLYMYLLGGILGALLGAFAVKFAARRNLSQPVEHFVADELRLLQLLEMYPGELVRGHSQLNRSCFTNDARRERWDAIERTAHPYLDELFTSQVAVAEKTNDEAAMAALASELGERLSSTARSEPAELSELMRTGSNVLSANAGREQNTVRSPLIETGNDTAPHARQFVACTQMRMNLAAVLGMLGGVLSAICAYSFTTTTSAALAAFVSLLCVLAGGIAIGAVDLDTYYLDLPVFIAWCAGSWVALIGAGALDHTVNNVIVGAAAALGVAIGFEVVARTWGKLRGITQGAGDTWIALVTAGVPAGLCGRWEVGVWSVIAASIGVALHWCALAARGKARADTPIPFGPHLAGGGFVALLVALVVL
jgi:prepilin signal peptidase PulO-like enzyme (type II secretory pathway)